MFDYKLNQNSKEPKYMQLATSIIEQIENGDLILNQKLPSVNKLSKKLHFSRETVFKALNTLSEKGIVTSVDKVGYFISDDSVENDAKVFLLLDKFTSFKQDLFNSLIYNLGDRAKVDVYFHHQDFKLFKSLILNNLKNYTHFVITTYLADNDAVASILKRIPPEKLIIIDKREPNLGDTHGMVFQDFENDIYNALYKNIHLVKKYKRLLLINHKDAPHGPYVSAGFKCFCEKFDFSFSIVEGFKPSLMQKETLYITMDAYDRDLVEIIKVANTKNWQVGREIGLLSYNDTPMKEILNGGITVVSTDFEEMGAEAAKMILERKMIQRSNLTRVIIRNSL